jgi:hypothetical protein
MESYLVGAAHQPSREGRKCHDHVHPDFPDEHRTAGALADVDSPSGLPIC